MYDATLLKVITLVITTVVIVAVVFVVYKYTKDM
jgi:hypothetical protein